MGISRSSYEIDLTAKADTTALERTIALLEKQRAIAEKSGRVSPELDFAIDSNKSALAAAKKAEEEVNQAAKEGVISQRELHQSIRLVGEASGGALGPIGELAHYLSNVNILAASGAVLAIKLYIEQLQAARENTLKLIQASQDFADKLREAAAKSADTASERQAAWNTQLAHSLDLIDWLTKGLERYLEVQRQVVEGETKVASAVERRIDAYIKLLAATGRISQPEAEASEARLHEEEEIRRQARENKAKEDEIDQRTATATNAGTNARTAQAQADSLEKERTRQQALLDRATTTQDEAKTQWHNAREEANQLRATLASLPQYEIGTAYYQQTQKKLEQAQKQEESFKAAYENEQDLIRRYNAQIREIDASIDSAHKLVESNNELARAQFEKAEQLRQDLARTKSTQGQENAEAHAARITEQITKTGHAGDVTYAGPDINLRIAGLEQRALQAVGFLQSGMNESADTHSQIFDIFNTLLAAVENQNVDRVDRAQLQARFCKENCVNGFLFKFL